MDVKTSRLRLCSLCIGNLFEHYDTALFGLLSSVLAPVIFPEKDPISALLLMYVMIPISMLARPVGAVLFGFIGDCYGRSVALFTSLTGMGLVSLCIAMAPSFIGFGMLPPLFWCSARAVQNLLAAGETCGGAIFLLESAEPKYHDLLSSIYSASTIGGVLLASIGTAVLATLNQLQNGWSYLYLLGSITALFGCLVRHNMRGVEARPAQDRSCSRNSFSLRIFWLHRTPLLCIAICSGFSYASYSIALIVLTGFIPLVSDNSPALMMHINTTLLVLDLLLLPFFGYVASKISRCRLMLLASIVTCVSAAPLFFLLEGASLGVMFGVRVCFVFMGAAFAAPMHALLQTLVPTSHRYSIISVGYALGSQILGGPTAAISLWLFKATGSYLGIAIYWMILALASGAFLFRLGRAKESTYQLG